MKAIKLFFTFIIVTILTLGVFAQERRVVVSPKNEENSPYEHNLNKIQKVSYTLNEINLINGNKVKIEGIGGTDAYAILDELNIDLYFQSSHNPDWMDRRMGDPAGRYEISFKINPIIYVDNKPVPFKDVIDFESTKELKLWGIHRLVGTTKGKEIKIITANGFLYGAVLVDMNSLTQQKYNSGLLYNWMYYFGTKDPKEAFSLFKAGLSIQKLSVPIALTLNGLYFKGAFRENTTAEIQITGASNKSKSDDDFWDSPTKAIAENNKDKDDFWNSPTQAIAGDQAKNNAKTTSAKTGTFTDSRDGKTYKYVTIGNQTWMAENLNYATSSGSWCYDNNSSNCATYGRLYNWQTAKNVCPAGWHLPSDAEWTQLTDFVGGSSNAGSKLKAKNGWMDNGNGTDEYGFTALPGGFRYDNGNFDSIGHFGRWWSATESDADYAWHRNMYYYYSNVFMYYYDKESGFSVRCVRD
jgi:uncharacterized protein (TIGR02145 family)